MIYPVGCMFLHVTYTQFRVNPYSICLNVKEVIARNWRDIWSLIDFNGTRTHNHLVCKWTLNDLAELASLVKHLIVLLRTKWLWVRVSLQALIMWVLYLYQRIDLSLI